MHCTDAFTAQLMRAWYVFVLSLRSGIFETWTGEVCHTDVATAAVAEHVRESLLSLQNLPVATRTESAIGTVWQK